MLNAYWRDKVQNFAPKESKLTMTTNPHPKYVATSSNTTTKWLDCPYYLPVMCWCQHFQFCRKIYIVFFKASLGGVWDRALPDGLPREFISDVVILKTNKKLEAQWPSKKSIFGLVANSSWSALRALLTTKTGGQGGQYSRGGVPLFNSMSKSKNCTSFKSLQQSPTLTRILPHLWMSSAMSFKWLTNSTITTSKITSPLGWTVWMKTWAPGLTSTAQVSCLSQGSCIQEGKKYCSITDGDQEKQIMWGIKLQDGKDQPMDQNNNPHYPTEFENYTQSSTLMLYMTKPIHNTGKIVTIDSRFCIAVGILVLHYIGVYRQASIEKWRRYWPKNVLGNEFEEYMKDKELGLAETYKQCIERKDFLVHCQQDSCYLTKLWAWMGLWWKRITFLLH